MLMGQISLFCYGYLIKQGPAIIKKEQLQTAPFMFFISVN
jgi:hypothetical protein